MYDSYRVNTKYKEPTLLCGRFVGAGTSVPAAVANTCKGLSVSRSGVGTLTVTCTDTPIGVIQSYQFSVASANANARAVAVTPPSAGANSFSLQVGLASNGAAVDLSSSEELIVEIWTARTQVP